MAIATAPDETRTATPPIRATPSRQRKPAKEGSAAGRLLSTTFLWLYAAVALGPLVLMVVNSFRTQQEMAQTPLGLPTELNFRSYQDAWLTASFETYFVNSMIVTVGAVLLSTVVSVLAAYSFARSRSNLFGGIEAVFLSGLLLPAHLAILPLFYLLDSMGLTSNLLSLVLVYGAMGIPFSTFILTVFFRQLPIELEEAALLDGAGAWRTFWYVLVPLVRPAIATVTVFRFVPVWNDFFYPLILMRDRASYTLPVGLTRFFGEYSADWPQLFAGLTIATLPLVVVFLFATKQIISGLTAGMSK